ncbi:MAG: hypothetical protein IKS99_02170 [Firmicutes bacterium]|nr:hypothetical protein [Bacillota bacterium]
MEKITDYGTIKISDNVFEKMIKDALSKTEGRDGLAIERKSILIEDGPEELKLEFHVVHMFGTSLRFSTKTILDHLERSIRRLGLGKNVRIVMKVVAIKARRSQKRDLEYSRIIK